MRRGSTDGGRAATALAAWVVAAAIVVGFLLAAGPAGAATPAWTTYGHDSARSQTDPDSTNPVAPTAAWTSQTLDGKVFAQPLVDGNLVYVATENDSIYALNAATGAVVWQRSVGTPAASSAQACGNILPTIGITGTPVIDPSTNRIYAVAETASGSTVSHQLVALDAATGAPVAGFPRPVDPANQAPNAILQRTALALDGGRIVFGYGGNYGDCASYHGYLVSAPADGIGANDVFTVDAGSGESQGSIWGAGDGPAQDANGDLFIETGNGRSSSPDLQESVVELNPDAGMIAHWTAPNWLQLDQSDTDLGSSEPLPLPGGLLFVAGKDGYGRLLSATALGSAGQVYITPARICPGEVDGASLYAGGTIYVPCTSGGIVALSLHGGSSPSLTKDAAFSPPSSAIGPPILAGGLVWTTGWNAGTLYGLDPTTGAVRYQTSPGTFEHFATPSAGGGRLFAAAGTKVTALTIATYPPMTATSTALSSSANPAAANTRISLTATVSPAPNGGTVTFTANGIPLPGCASVSVSASAGTATCTASFPPGTDQIVARYGGDAAFGPSASPALAEQVQAIAPRITRASLRPRRATTTRGTTLRYSLSQAATVTVAINRLSAGRRPHRRCVAGARRGRRCTISHRVRRVVVNARGGSRRLHLRLLGLRSGRYTVTVQARNGYGLRSPTTTLRLTIVRPRRR